MFHQQLKEAFNDAVSQVTEDISSYAVHPEKDLSRTKKISPDILISFLVSQGASSSKCEILDFFNLSPDRPTLSAINQRRAQLKPEALAAVFYAFNEGANALHTEQEKPTYRYLAADGSTATFFSFPKFASSEYYVSEGHSARGFYSIHINAMYALNQRVYTDALLQPVHQKDEFRAFCTLVDRDTVYPGTPTVYIGDRGYCSYNNMAHVIQKSQFFLFRTKDVGKKGLIGKFDFPNSDEFDVSVNVTLTRSHSKKITIKEGFYRRFIDKAASFDFLEYGSLDTYDLNFRVARFKISADTYECVVTNLPENEFPPSELKKVYNTRWGIESSFRKLKYTIGLNNYHSYKPEYIKQEIWAKLIAYNATEYLISNVILEKKETQYEYAINFTVAAHICRLYLRLLTEIESIDVAAVISTELVPIRKERQFPRLQTAHFRKPKYMIYRAA